MTSAPVSSAVSNRLHLSECFLSLQGEGPSAGTPAHFVRLQGCEVGCHWCDSKYTWSPEGGRDVGVDELLKEARALGEAPLLVVTGGEPLSHQGIERLLKEGLERWPRVEVETSGVEPPPLHHRRLYFNVSPKLPSATPLWADTWRHAQAWRAEPRATFKIVVGEPPDLDDARRLIAENLIERDRVMIMPQGVTDEQVRERALKLADECKRFGFRMSPRLHIWMWGPRRGA